MLPDLSGFELGRVLRHGGKTPIIILSARGEKADKLHGASPRGRRLHHQAVRHGGAGRAHQHGAAPRQARDSRRFNWAGSPSTSGSGPPPARDGDLHLTHREFEILRVLAERHSRVVFRDELFKEVWGFLDTRRPARSIGRCRGCGRRSRPTREPTFSSHGPRRRLHIVGRDNDLCLTRRKRMTRTSRRDLRLGRPHEHSPSGTGAAQRD